MHDLDGTQPMLRSTEYEFTFGTGSERGEAEFETEGEMNEAETAERASELLEVQSEEELDHFFGDIVDSVGSAVSGVAGTVSNFANSPTGQALVGTLKDAAKSALPVIGQAIGTRYGGAVGGQLGQMAGDGLGAALGLELEGLSPEDQHFEAAQQVVRLASEAARQAAAATAMRGSPQQKAKTAVVEAAKTYAPGLIRPIAGPIASMRNGNGKSVARGRMESEDKRPARPEVGAHRRHGRASGRWTREGDTIVLMGI